MRPATTPARRALYASLGFALAASIQCGGGPDEPAAPPVLTISGGNGQTAAVGTAVTTPPAVKAADANGNGVSGIAVTFAVASGGGSVTGATQTTNGSGIATLAGWTLGSALGANSVTATSSDATGGPLTFTALATAGPAAAVTVNAGNNQTVVTGSAVPIAPSVKVADAGGNPVSGTAVTFAIASGGGSITGGSQVTNASGIATLTTWTPGTTGTNTLTATAAGLATAVTFTATAAIGPANKLLLTSTASTTAKNRTAFTTQPVVQIADANGNSVPQAGTVITAAIQSGGGTLSGTLTATTNGTGLATFTNLSIAGVVGARTLVLSATSLTSATATVTTTAGNAATIAVDVGNNQTAVAGTAVSVPPAAKVTDQDGNAVSGVGVGFAITAGGGSLTGATTNTGSNGVATVGSWTLGAAAGTNTMEATSSGLTGSPLVFTANGSSATGIKLTLTTSPSASAVNRVAFAAQPVVQLRDAANTAITQAGVVVTAAITSGGGTLNGTTTATTNTSGVATFTNLSIAGTIGARTVNFTAPTYTNVSATVTTTVGTAATIAVNANDNQSAVAGGQLPVAPSVKVTDADANAVQGVAVTFAVASGGGSGTGLTPSTNASGIAAPGSWTLGATPGSNTMTATASGLSGSPVTLTATGTASPVTLTSVAPSTLTPGVSATITGTGFNATPASNTVTIDGVAASVTGATPTQLTVTVPASMPCEATHNATISVTVTGNPAQTITKPLQVANQRALAVGEAIFVSTPAQVRCNELSNTGTSRYLVNVYNTNTTYSSTGANFQLRGAAGSGSAGLSPKAADLQARARYAAADARIRPVVQRRPADPGDVLHAKVLEINRQVLAAQRGRVQPRANSANRTMAVPAVGDQMTIKVPNINNNPCTNSISITARVAYVSNKAILVEDITNPVKNIDTTYQQIGDEFDGTMYPILNGNYGDPLALDASLDNNGREIMVFTHVVNDQFIGIAGFVIACDLYPTTTYPSSNVGEYFYAVVPTSTGTINTAGTTSPPKWRWSMRGTIIHESKHIASQVARKKNNAIAFEESWLEETTARMSEELYERAVYGFNQKANIGYGNAGNPAGPYCGVRPTTPACAGKPRGFVRVFEELQTASGHQGWMSIPEDLSPIGRKDASDFSFYSTGWSLVRWSIDQSALSEAAFLTALTQETQKTGIANLEARTSRTFADMIPEWQFANVLDDYLGFAPTLARLAQPGWNFRSVFAGLNTDFPTTYANWPFVPFARSFGTFTVDSHVVPGSASFVEMSGTASAKQLIELRGAGGTGAAPAELRIAIVRIQ